MDDISNKLKEVRELNYRWLAYNRLFLLIFTKTVYIRLFFWFFYQATRKLKEIPQPPANPQFEINRVTKMCEDEIRQKLENTGTNLNDKNDNLWERMREQLNEYRMAIGNERPAFMLMSPNVEPLFVDILKNIPKVNNYCTYDSIAVTSMKIVSGFCFCFCFI